MKYKLAIFDLDGTILDTVTDLTNAFNHVADEFGFFHRSESEVRGFMGNGLKMLAKLGSPEGTDENTVASVHKAIVEYYFSHCDENTRPYVGIPELLKALKFCGVKIAVVSNKIDSAAKLLCQHHFGNLIDYVAGEKEGVAKKPSPEPIIKAMNYFSADENSTVCIGDTEVDFYTAQNSHTDSVLVTWGFRDESVIKNFNSTYLAKTPNEINHIILG